MKNSTLFKLFPIFFGFFVMGFVDIVGISTNYIKQDFALSDTLSNLLPMMVFLWFAVLSVPVSLLMNKIGRKNMVQVSFIITAIALLVPSVVYNFQTALVAFALLGIGNTILQVSMNPLVTNVIPSEKIPSSLTLGQFIKAIASFIGPISAIFAAKELGDWKLIFPAYAIVSILSFIWLGSIKVERETKEKSSITYGQCFGLLNSGYLLMLFLGILFIVGIDVGLNTSIPKFINFKSQLPLEKAGLGTSLYFAARTLGTFAGTFILIKVPIKKVLYYSSIVAIAFYCVMLFSSSLWLISSCIVMVGFAIANVFSMIFSLAIQRMPEKTNEISGLMVMGIAGGAFVLPIMGFLSDTYGQTAGMMVLLACLVYIFFISLKVRKQEQLIQS